MAPSLHPRASGTPGMSALSYQQNPVIGWHPIDRQHHSFGNDTLQARAPPSVGDHENLQGALLEPGNNFFSSSGSAKETMQRSGAAGGAFRERNSNVDSQRLLRRTIRWQPIQRTRSRSRRTPMTAGDSQALRPSKRKKDNKKDKEQRSKVPGPQPTLNVSAPSPPHIRYPLSLSFIIRVPVHCNYYPVTTCKA